MRISPSLCVRIVTRRGTGGSAPRWRTFAKHLDSRWSAIDRPALEELPASSLGRPAPGYRRFKPTSHFSIYKRSELQRTIDNASGYKLVFLAPQSSLLRIKNAIFEVGGGTLHDGKFTRCSFETIGTYQFRPQVGSVGTGPASLGRTKVTQEVKVEIPCQGRQAAVDAVRALLHNHPYNTVSYEVYKVEVGFGPHQVTTHAPRISPSYRAPPPSNKGVGRWDSREGVENRPQSVVPKYQYQSSRQVRLNLGAGETHPNPAEWPSGEPELPSGRGAGEPARSSRYKADVEEASPKLKALLSHLNNLQAKELPEDVPSELLAATDPEKDK
ncbi:hypothetical protein DRE_07466 [Drechslerella stenobrocha 248]|uniref:ATP phosphoribosyltransferase n=1 Tax=Drechslerella stenobrocha 248 TaxID=1043628 RepID=W7HL13_9PEZI|nr:hypothetical protein DRE_07466 [Drechslerella stenobrocha 248]